MLVIYGVCLNLYVIDKGFVKYDLYLAHPINFHFQSKSNNAIFHDHGHAVSIMLLFIRLGPLS